MMLLASCESLELEEFVSEVDVSRALELMIAGTYRNFDEFSDGIVRESDCGHTISETVAH